MKRESFVFYKSFYESIKELKLEEQVQIYNAIFQYQFEGKLTELKSVCKSIFTLILPQLDANNKKYENGKKGGRPKHNQTITKIKPNDNQTITKQEPNVNVNVNDNVNVNVNDICNFFEKKFGRGLTPNEFEKLNNWLLIFNDEIIKYAIDISCDNNKKTFRYIEGILNNWKSAGFKKINEIKEPNYKENKILEIIDYDWLNDNEVTNE